MRPIKKRIRRTVTRDGQGGKVKELTIGDWKRVVKKYKGSDDFGDKGKKVKEVEIYKGYKEEPFAAKDTPNVLKRKRRKVRKPKKS